MNDVNGFVSAEGEKLINGNGCEILLRGVGLGNWLLPEGYMWCFPDEGDRPRRIEQMIKTLIGSEKAQLFWETFREFYISEKDIRRISEEGFNSVRVPVNSRYLLEDNEDHLKYIDRLLDWCETHSIYVILDLHGAPGGQTGTNIDDSENNHTDLFTNEENKKLTIDIWRMLAKRYENKWIIAGYDLLNEPLPQWFSQYNDQVMPLYRDIIKAIREVDSRHMIILEGVHWATDWSVFTEKPDENIMLQFHKYWNNPDTESIQLYLDKRREWRVPIFMGEGGENNTDWYTGAFRLFEAHNISWSFWTWKKLNTNNSPCSIQLPPGWELLTDFLKKGTRLRESKAEEVLWCFLTNILFENCAYRKKVVNSIFRRPEVRIPAIFYENGGENTSYRCYQKKGNNTGFRIGDAANICFVSPARSEPNFQHGRGEPWRADEWMYLDLSEGDWYAYEFSVEKAAGFSFDFMLLAPLEEAVISVDIQGILYTVGVSNKEWGAVSLKKEFFLEPGGRRLVLKAEKSRVCFKWLVVKPA